MRDSLPKIACVDLRTVWPQIAVECRYNMAQYGKILHEQLQKLT